MLPPVTPCHLGVTDVLLLRIIARIAIRLGLFGHDAVGLLGRQILRILGQITSSRLM